LATVLASALGDVGRSLREGFFMFWETLVAADLRLHAVRRSAGLRVSRADAAGDGHHGPGAVARAAGFGRSHRRVSYAATAMAKSLFQKGADFTTAMIFMFASTNLVVELGVVLVVLIGWQFAAAEFVGGAIHDRALGGDGLAGGGSPPG